MQTLHRRKVLLTGDRNWSDEGLVQSILVMLQPDEVCHGAARGLDRVVGRKCAELGIPCTAFPAQWKEYGRAAGPIRNRQMLDEFRPDIVVAVHDDLQRSGGTKDMVLVAIRSRVDVYQVTHNWEDER